MKRLVLALSSLALVLSACAVGEPLPPTAPTPTSITLNGNVYSTFGGPTEYWWEYGETTDYGTQTPIRSVDIAEEDRYEAHSVLQPLAGLTPSTRYHYKFCVRDHEENPGRVVCSKDQRFGTVGDVITGGGITSDTSWQIDVRGGPDGENPYGTVFGRSLGQGIPPTLLQATCLRIVGQNATVGTEEGFYRFSPGSGRSFWMLVEPLGERDLTDCPEPVTVNSGTFVSGDLLFFDTP